VEPAATANDGRARFLVHAGNVVQANDGRVSGGDGLVLRADFQRGPWLVGRDLGQVGVAVEAVLTGVVARLNFDETDVQQRVAVGGEGEGAGDVDGADDVGRFGV